MSGKKTPRTFSIVT